MRKFLQTLLLLIPFFAISQQKANYTLAARFSPKKLEKMIFSLAVDPHWLKQSNKFWYTYETSEGKQWNIVDPLKNEKKAMFNRVSFPIGVMEMPLSSIPVMPLNSAFLTCKSELYFD